MEDEWHFAFPSRAVKVNPIMKVNLSRLADSGVGHADVWEEYPTRGKAGEKSLCLHVLSLNKGGGGGRHVAGAE